MFQERVGKRAQLVGTEGYTTAAGRHDLNNQKREHELTYSEGLYPVLEYTLKNFLFLIFKAVL